jgi:hypothetical protein
MPMLFQVWMKWNLSNGSRDTRKKVHWSTYKVPLNLDPSKLNFQHLQQIGTMSQVWIFRKIPPKGNMKQVLLIIDWLKPNLYLYQISIVFGHEQNTKQCEEGESQKRQWQFASGNSVLTQAYYFNSFVKYYSQQVKEHSYLESLTITVCNENAEWVFLLMLSI